MTTTGTTTPTLARDAAHRGWVCYDGECPMCTGSARRLTPLLGHYHFDLIPLQTPWVTKRLGLKAGEPLAEMKLLTADGRVFGGAEAVVQVARSLWWAWPFYALAQAPGAMILFRAMYRWVAANRTCEGGVCDVPKQNHWGDYVPLAVLPVAALAVENFLPAWVFMWLLAFALYFGCKWLTWRRAMRQVGDANHWISLGYLFGWVGMDAKRFLHGRQALPVMRGWDWFWPTLNILAGVALIWVAVPAVVGMQPLLAGWLGMCGIILCLHFGTFELIARGWELAGVDAPPIMRGPVWSASVTEFWGKRWNNAFSQLANEFLFRPGLKKWGVGPATWLVFLVSGLIHELLISLPACGGYGLPTAYFLIQGLGITLERTAFGKRLGLGYGWRGRLFAIVCTAGPAFWLFHPIFVRNVILPMLHTLGAT